MPEPDPEQLLAYLTDEDEEVDVPPGTPLRVLREIANNGNDQARVAAARILLAREDERRARREANTGLSEEALNEARRVAALTDAELDAEIAGFAAGLFEDMVHAEVKRRMAAQYERLIEDEVQRRVNALAMRDQDDDQTESADAGDDSGSIPDPPSGTGRSDSRGIPLPPGIDDPAALDAAWGGRRPRL